MGAKVTVLSWFLLLGLSVSTSAFAAPLDATAICGTANEEMSQELKGTLQGQAQTFARIGAAELHGAVSSAKSEIEFGKNRSDAARELHYLRHASCMLIILDNDLSTDEKLRRIRALSVLTKDPQDYLPANFSETGACQSIRGTWYNSDLRIVVPIRQDGCKISSEYKTPLNFGLFSYNELTGHADEDKFEVTVNSTDPYGCAVVFYGRITAIEPRQLTSHIYRSSGNCSYPQNYTQTLTWVRR